MQTAFYAGASGLAAFQERMDVIGNNIANCNTAGYKARKTTFSQLLATRMDAHIQAAPLVGSGVRAVSAGIDASGGAVTASHGTFDLAILGDGWFCVENNKQKQYTRDGAFTVNLTDDEAYLVTQSGAYVLDSSGDRISVETDAKTHAIDLDSVLEKVGVFMFLNPGALTPVSSNGYLPNDVSGKAEEATAGQYTILQGFLELSGVSLADEMAALITAQRGYQLSARVVETADEAEQAANSLRG